MSVAHQILLTYNLIARVTIGVSGTIAGWSITVGNVFGAIAPAGPRIRGVVIQRIAVSNADDLFIWFNGTAPQNYFNGIVIEDGNGVRRTYLTSSATYSGGAEPSWTWGTGSNKTWTTADSTEVRSISFF